MTFTVQGTKVTFSFLCAECADQLKGVDRVDRLPTWHFGQCDRCWKHRPLCAADRWTWPGEKK